MHLKKFAIFASVHHPALLATEIPAAIVADWVKATLANQTGSNCMQRTWHMKPLEKSRPSQQNFLPNINPSRRNQYNQRDVSTIQPFYGAIPKKCHLPSIHPLLLILRKAETQNKTSIPLQVENELPGIGIFDQNIPVIILWCIYFLYLLNASFILSQHLNSPSHVSVGPPHK